MDLEWKKSSKSSGNGQCVAWARNGDDVMVKDTKNPDGPMLRFTRVEWEAFVQGVKAGEADLQ